MRRIANWHVLIPAERAAAQRRIAGRNGKRLEVCRQLEAEARRCKLDPGLKATGLKFLL